MTTILFLLFVIYAAYCWSNLRRVQKHDRVLFPFCQLRRDVMKFLRNHYAKDFNSLSRKECESVLRLSEVLDDAIHNYSEHKTTLFNLRKVMELLKRYRHMLKRVEPLNPTKNKEIQAFHNRFVLCWAKAFLAYTPLIRSEIVWRMFVFMYRTKSERVRKNVIEIAKQVRINETAKAA